MDNQKETIIDISCSLSLILQEIIKEKQTKKHEIQDIIKSQPFEGLEILKHLGDFIKITPTNYQIIQQNSQYFSSLQEACNLYEKIIENCEIDQQNFINILILDYLLINITETNAYLYSIYSNLFLVDIDVYSFYQTIFMHVFGLPNSIYEICLFIKNCNDIHDNKKILRKFFLDYKIKYQTNHKWEIGTFGYFLYRFELIEKCDLINYYEYWFTHLLNDKIFMNDNFFECLKKRKFSDTLLNLIVNDDANQFGVFVSTNHIDINSNLQKPNDISITKLCTWITYADTACINDVIYWPFGQIKKISIIEFSAFLGSLKVFKYLVLNHADIEPNLIDFAIAGGNLEIVHTCQQLECKLSRSSFEIAVRYYQTEIFAWLVDNNPDLIQFDLNRIFEYIFSYSNPQAFLILYQNLYENQHQNFVLNRLDLIQNREWIRFLIRYDDLIYRFIDFNNDKCITILLNYSNIKTLKILIDELGEKIDFNINKVWENHHLEYNFLHSSIHSIEYYFNQKGELDKYKNELILPPFPNHFIFNYLRRNSNYTNFIQHDIKFFIFLIKNKFFNFENSLKIEKIIYYVLNTEKYEFLELFEKADPAVLRNVRSFIFDKDWFYFLYENEMRKKFFFKSCLLDDESNLRFQTEGLHYACYYGDLTTVKILLKRKFIDVNSEEFDNGRTPLNLASECNFIRIVNLLINDERVDVNAFSYDHKTSFYLAVENNHIEIVELFLKSDKVDINIVDKNGKTPFFVACEKGYYKIVQKLLQRCNLNLNTMVKNNSPFGLAVENWHFKVVEILMNEKRIKFQSENEKNPLQRACYNCNLKMVEILFTIESINKNELDDIFFFNIN